MQLLKRITDGDVLGLEESTYMDTVTRYGSRGVLVDKHLNVAMMYMSKTNLYKLPGGGIDRGESSSEAFIREIKEETGYAAEIIHELGYIEEHKNRNHFLQFSYCYVAKALDHVSRGHTNLSDSELELGMGVKWMPLHTALEVMNESALLCDDYSTKFMIIRERIILEKAIEILAANSLFFK